MLTSSVVVLTIPLEMKLSKSRRISCGSYAERYSYAEIDPDLSWTQHSHISGTDALASHRKQLVAKEE